MRRIFIIATHAFKETIRDRVVYGILAFGLLFIGSTVVLGTLSLGEDLKVIRDFGLAGVYIFGFVITIFLGASLMHKEVVDRTIYLILTKPVSRFEAIAGKFFGLLASMGTATLLMTAVYLTIIGTNGGGFDVLALEAAFLQIFELGIFISLAIFFSLMSGPLLAVIYCICIVYIGHSLELLIKFGADSGIYLLKWFTLALYYLLPNLEKFNIRDLVVHQKGISSLAFLSAFIYAVIYCVLLLWASEKVLKNKEL